MEILRSPACGGLPQNDMTLCFRAMDTKTVESLKSWFDEYVTGFKSGDPAYDQSIVLKEEHTRRVCDEIMYIGKGLGLPENDLRLAQAIALLHDMGRFEQYARYRTFNDRQSVNHAELGVQILRERRVLESVEERELILRAVEYHNRAALPQDETERCLLFSRMVRDADKLDIWRVFLDYYAQKGGKADPTVVHFLPDTPGFSDNICKGLLNRRSVNYTEVKNLNDFKLLQIGWVYDLNFAPSFRRLRERKIVEKYCEFLPESKEIDAVFTVVRSYLKKKDREMRDVSVGDVYRVIVPH
ncbi:MAG: HD domain-containing protein, partial [Chloroflexi bacterium]|nr:HD domain-containing protein [Chloroflexota bacterium]